MHWQNLLWIRDRSLSHDVPNKKWYKNQHTLEGTSVSQSANNFIAEIQCLLLFAICSVARVFVWNSLEFESIRSTIKRNCVLRNELPILILMWLWRLRKVKFRIGSEKSGKCFLYVILLFPCNFLRRNYRYFANVNIERLFNHLYSSRQHEVLHRIHCPFWGSTYMCGCCWDSESLSQRTFIEHHLCARFPAHC